MTVEQAIVRSYMLATGKVKTDLIPGNSKYDRMLELMRYCSELWANDEQTDWNSLREVFDLGVVATTDTYDLDEEMLRTSKREGDFVRIRHASGNAESHYTIVPIGQLYGREGSLEGASNRVAIAGGALIFSAPFKSTDVQFGGRILVPGVRRIEELTGPSDEIQVDDPNWLCQMVAAEFVRNDITRVAQYSNLIAMAEDTMAKMRRNNEPQTEMVNLGSWSPLGESW